MLTDQERIELAKTAFITTPAVANILMNIERCRRLSLTDAEPSCMMVYGSTGEGKTSIIRKYVKENSRKSLKEGDIVPVLYIELPENAKPIDAAREILLQLNDPLALYESDVTILTKRIIELVPLLKIELIIVDEFQHLVEKNSNKILARVGDWLKILINKTKCPIILFGMPYSKVVLMANSQLRSRFSIQFHLRPFSYSEGKKHIFLGFLKQLDKSLPFEELTGLEKEPLSKKLFAFSGGNMRSLRNLIFHASVQAIENNRTFISSDDFLYASQLTSGDKLSTWKNPFEKGAEITKDMLEDAPHDIGWEDYHSNNNPRSKKPLDGSKIFNY